MTKGFSETSTDKELMLAVDSNFMEGVKGFFGSDEKKELVDPYFVLSFAGKEVKSRIMYNNDHPEWNEELRVGLRVCIKGALCGRGVCDLKSM